MAALDSEQVYVSTPTPSECGDLYTEGLAGDGGCTYQECMNAPPTWPMQSQDIEAYKPQYEALQMQMMPGVWMQPVMMPVYLPCGGMAAGSYPAEQPAPNDGRVVPSPQQEGWWQDGDAEEPTHANGRHGDVAQWGGSGDGSGSACGSQEEGWWQDHESQEPWGRWRRGGLPAQEQKKKLAGAASPDEVDKMKLALQRNMQAHAMRNAETRASETDSQPAHLGLCDGEKRAMNANNCNAIVSKQKHAQATVSQDNHGSAIASKENVVDRKVPSAKPKSQEDARSLGNVDPMVLELDGPDEKRRQYILGWVSESFWPLALNKRGCRILQKAIDVGSPTYQGQLLQNLHGHVYQAMQSLHANYVLQKFIELMPPDSLGFIVTELQGQVLTVARHRFGCRILQRLVEHCTPAQTERMVHIILGDATALLRHSYGNFILQHILQHGTPCQRTAIADVILADIIRLSKHRLASHVVSCSLVHCASEDVQRLTDALLNDEGQCAHLARREYGSFVVREAHRALRLLNSNGMIEGVRMSLAVALE